MKIINPLYDLAFKYLMQNERYAKRVLSIILETEVYDVHLEQQETILNEDERKLKLFRLDFRATLKDEKGITRTVLIELQKSKYSTDIERFRNYLGMSYLSKYPTYKDINDDMDVVSEPQSKYHGHPIITIYILGYKIEDLPYLAVTVNRDVIDSVTKQKIKESSSFIEHLTHRSHILQVERLPEERRSKLEQFMSFFNQAWCSSGSKYILELQDIPGGFEDMAEYLSAALQDDEFRRKLEAEDQIDRAFQDKEQQYLQSEKMRIEAEKQKIEAEKREMEAEKREMEERRQKEEERRQRKEERKKREVAEAKLKNAIRNMHQRGFSIQEIAESFGVEVDFVEGVVSNG